MTKTLLIDGDALVYQLAFTAETSVNWADIGQPELWTIWADSAETEFRLHRAVEALKERHGADKVIFALTDPAGVFRNDFWPSYKGNRSTTRKPLLHGPLREIVTNAPEWTTFLRPRLEADDLIGILATHPTLVPGEKLIVSDDKDFNTIPAPRVKFDGSASEVEEVTDCSADRYHMIQTLTGDTTDNYPGCPGIGPVKANQLLDKVDEDIALVGDEWSLSAWNVIVKAYAKAGLTEEDALIQARCARILRATDYDFKNKEPILWTPSHNS